MTDPATISAAISVAISAAHALRAPPPSIEQEQQERGGARGHRTNK
jgi:hypothetical protein